MGRQSTPTTGASMILFKCLIILSLTALAFCIVAEISPSLKQEIDHFEGLMVQDPKNHSLRFTLGMLYQLASRPKQVCDNLHAAYIGSPQSAPPELLFHLANNLKAIGENEAAVNFYALAIGLMPEGPVNWVLISITLDFIGRTQVHFLVRLSLLAALEKYFRNAIISFVVRVCDACVFLHVCIRIVCMRVCCVIG
jgi:hypothetical protein